MADETPKPETVEPAGIETTPNPRADVANGDEHSPPSDHAVDAPVENEEENQDLETDAEETEAEETDADASSEQEGESDDDVLDETGDDESSEDESEDDAGDEGASDEGASEEDGQDDNKRWYVVKVQSGREDTIKAAIERRVKIENLEEFYGKIVVPVEKYTDIVRGKRVVKERKLYPGYLMVFLEYNDRMLYLFRETSGVGDFVGGAPNKAPIPMNDDEIRRMLVSQGDEDTPKPVGEAPSPYEQGDHVKVKDGPFAGMEGEVKEVLEAKGCIRVEMTIFGRPVSVELEYWQVDSL